MRVDVTKKPVGAYFGGKPAFAHSVLCPICSKPGLIKRRTVRGGDEISHGFALKLNSKNEPEVIWDEPCVARKAS
jgi:hypothetical protein